MQFRLVWSLLFLAAPAWAASPAPADCPTLPTAPGNTIPLNVMPRIAPRPGMPQGGYVGLGLNGVPANGTVCVPADPVLPRDVLHGDTDTDPLSGKPTRGQVFIEMR